MNGVNARGTYLCSQACLPYLKLGKNPHILNIAPPLNMKPIWFKNHTAYTMAKYGMSMCVLGMAEEFKPDGIAVNALWPKTGIATAAIEMLGGDELMKASRKPEIMSDAAYAILNKDSRSYTGKFDVDEELLRSIGIKDFDQYAWEKGVPLMPDYFLDDAEEFYAGNVLKKKVEATTPAQAAAAEASAGANSPVDVVFKQVEAQLNAEMVKSINTVYRFVIKGEKDYVVDLQNGDGKLIRDAPEDIKAKTTLIMSGGDFVKMFEGKLNSMQAFMGGKLKIKGDMGSAMKLEKLMKKVQSKL